ncbi:hypothetical protein [Streptomyces carpinensis]|uniref:Uncharacterized protein n=1 Tax=Streptomyces carpinensis TaxID=66369 RepID=A0ABV1VW74_9ACTN|nr:hypothetical protein [Streptomyces carpinensis]
MTAATQFIDATDAYVKVRKDVISHRPAYMLAVVPQLIRPSVRLENEVTAVERTPRSSCTSE